MSYQTPQFHVLITDYAWATLEPEKEILLKVGASLIVAKAGNEDELIKLAPKADAILTCWQPVTARVIQRAGRCQIIGRYGIGLDNIDITLATKQGIVVTNVPAYCIEEVTDHVMALLLALARKVVLFDRNAKEGCYGLEPGRPIFRIRGKTLGIIGFGRIGRTLARKSHAFGLKVVAFDPYLTKECVTDHDIQLINFNQLLERSDFISIHVPLSEETHHLFGHKAFQKMKPGSFLINTSRGAVVHPTALINALDANEIAGAALDVLSVEPPDLHDPAVHHPKIIVTPHSAFYSQESVLDLQKTAAQQVADLLSGKVPESVVNSQVFQNPNLRALINT